MNVHKINRNLENKSNIESLREREIKIGSTAMVNHNEELIKVLNIVYFGSETHNAYTETRIIYDRGSVDIEFCSFFSE